MECMCKHRSDRVSTDPMPVGHSLHGIILESDAWNGW
jgi:hypothetical protein